MYLKNWRPITDYKLATKVITTRLKRVLLSIINEDQTAFIKERYIGENIKVILDFMQMSMTSQQFIDCENAFDCIKLDFINKAIEYYTI